MSKSPTHHLESTLFESTMKSHRLPRYVTVGAAVYKIGGVTGASFLALTTRYLQSSLQMRCVALAEELAHTS